MLFMEGFLNPNEVLNQLELSANMTAADFGSGSGGWAIPLAKRLEKGRVFAIDILEEPLSALKGKAALGKLSNVQTILADVEKGTELLDGSCDLVLMTNLLFQVDDIGVVFQEALRVLRKGGKILIVDWKEDAPFGPKEKRVSPEEVKKTAKELGSLVEKEFSAGSFHWGLILGKL